MTKDVETLNMFVKVVNSLSFIFGQKPKNMYYVLNKVGSFDELLVLALAAIDMKMEVDEAWRLCEETKTVEEEILKKKEELKEKMGEVIHLWKNKEDSFAATVNGSKERT